MAVFNRQVNMFEEPIEAELTNLKKSSKHFIVLIESLDRKRKMKLKKY